MRDFLENIANDEVPNSYTALIKVAANYALAHLEVFHLLARIIWCRIFTLFQVYLTENGEKVCMTTSNFTFATGKLHQLFLTS